MTLPLSMGFGKGTIDTVRIELQAIETMIESFGLTYDIKTIVIRKKRADDMH